MPCVGCVGWCLTKHAPRISAPKKRGPYRDGFILFRQPKTQKPSSFSLWCSSWEESFAAVVPSSPSCTSPWACPIPPPRDPYVTLEEVARPSAAVEPLWNHSPGVVPWAVFTRQKTHRAVSKGLLDWWTEETAYHPSLSRQPTHSLTPLHVLKRSYTWVPPTSSRVTGYEINDLWCSTLNALTRLSKRCK